VIAFILKSIASGLWQPIAKLLGYGAAYFKGRADAKAKADLRDLKAHQKTTERMQDADATLGDDPAALRDWLRERSSDKR
jgi:hypothetical protein